jgi:hypothetical protein
MLRAAALSLMLLVSMAVVLPLVNSTAHNGRPSVSRKHRKKYRRHSRAWWRRYRARLRRKRLAALRRRRQEFAFGRLPRVNNPLLPPAGDGRADWARAFPSNGGEYNDPRGLSLTMPGGWSTRPVVADGETRFRVFTRDGRPAGEAFLSYVSPAWTNSNDVLPVRNQRRMLAGVPFTDLRRLVINRMITANGWVINDFEREIGGRRVFVVLAQTAASSDGRTPPQSWTFYFAELDGRIYSFAASAPPEFADRMAAESEKVLASLRLRSSRSAMLNPPPR